MSQIPDAHELHKYMYSQLSTTHKQTHSISFSHYAQVFACSLEQTHSTFAPVSFLCHLAPAHPTSRLGAMHAKNVVHVVVEPYPLLHAACSPASRLLLLELL
jgi:hypothetical protein